MEPGNLVYKYSCEYLRASGIAISNCIQLSPTKLVNILTKPQFQAVYTIIVLYEKRAFLFPLSSFLFPLDHCIYKQV